MIRKYIYIILLLCLCSCGRETGIVNEAVSELDATLAM